MYSNDYEQYECLEQMPEMMLGWSHSILGRPLPTLCLILRVAASSGQFSLINDSPSLFLALNLLIAF